MYFRKIISFLLLITMMFSPVCMASVSLSANKTPSEVEEMWEETGGAEPLLAEDSVSDITVEEIQEEVESIEPLSTEYSVSDITETGETLSENSQDILTGWSPTIPENKTEELLWNDEEKSVFLLIHSADGFPEDAALSASLYRVASCKDCEGSEDYERLKEDLCQEYPLDNNEDAIQRVCFLRVKPVSEEEPLCGDAEISVAFASSFFNGGKIPDEISCLFCLSEEVLSSGKTVWYEPEAFSYQNGAVSFTCGYPCILAFMWEEDTHSDEPSEA